MKDVLEFSNGKMINVKEIRSIAKVVEEDFTYYGIAYTKNRFKEEKVRNKDTWRIKEIDYIMQNGFNTYL